MDMSMAAADEDEILSDRNRLSHRRHYARALVASPFPNERNESADGDVVGFAG
jgi:hypothetical protein